MIVLKIVTFTNLSLDYYHSNTKHYNHVPCQQGDQQFWKFNSHMRINEMDMYQKGFKFKVRHQLLKFNRILFAIGDWLTE